ncbi:hypothetical protein [uncultured Holdemanella sp.]|uniref:hypothetical protein n=1 Tax=uncultured Holdemanella sp. TaxID=1763549 RepID=UPI0025E73C48|nr:hypothetical protein [uncultured Holdemanella sp.]
MKNRFIIAVISTTLLLSVCACSNSKEKKDEKVVHKKKETMEVKQDAVSLPEEAETKPVADATLSDLYTDEELLAYANNHLADYWHTYYCFMAGTYFEGSGEIGNKLITDPNIHSLQDVENVWYQYFSKKYPIPYMDINTNVYKEAPFWEENGQVYERYRIDGIPHVSFFFDHITQKTDDEVWFAYYCKGPDGSISDTQQQWSFVYEDGQLKYGTIIRNN